MSIKDKFKEKKSKLLKSHSLETAGKEAESHKYIEQFLDDKNRFIPQVDYSDPATFARFGLAEKYYEDSIKRIYMTYPYDGSFYERTAWMNSSSYFDLYVFDQLYPRTNGHALFSPGTPADHAGSTSKGETVHNKTYKYGVPTTKEYILIKGGPSADPDDSDIKKIFPNIASKTKDNRAANVYNISENQESNLKIGGVDGNTIEFWLKKDAWTYNATTNAQNEVLFDLHNINAVSSSHAYSRLRVELDGKPNVDSPIRVTYMSGANGCFQVPLGHGSGSTSGSAYVTKASVADGNWHHYAIVLQNSGSDLLDPRKTSSAYAQRHSNGTPIEDQTDYKSLRLDLYIDGYHNSTVFTGSSVDYVSASLHATIGALATAPSSSEGVFDGTTMLGAGKLSASVDEFRFWKKARTAEEIGNFWKRDIGGGTNVDTANTDLGVYYKFNEGITGQSTTDSTVLDYSGRISNGTWTGYSSNSRSIKSAIVQSSASATEFKDPIIYSFHPDVDTLLTNKKNKGQSHDFQNPAAIYYKLPEWITSEDAASGEELKNLTQIIASYFDTLAMQIKSIAETRNITYPSGSHKPKPFVDNLLESQGFVTSEIFSDATIAEEFLQVGDEKVYQEKLNNIKNLIYRNIYNNLNFIQKSKGTEKSFRNFIRCFGVDDDHIRLNLYANNSTFELKDNFRYVAKKKKYVDFDDSTRNSAVVFQMSGSDLTAATATITFTGDPTVNQTITITSADGNSLTYTAKNAGNSAARTFDCNNGVITSATTLKAAIEDSTASTGGHAGDITVSRDGATLTLTQVGKGIDGNVSITHNLSNTTVAGFSGGSGNSHRRYLKGLPSHDGLGMTFECEAIFPKKRDLASQGYYPFSDLTASVFGIHTPLEQSDADQHTQFAGTDSANFQVLVYKEKADSPHVKFALTSSANTLNFTSDNAVASHINTIKNYGLTSSQFYDVYSNQRWNFAVRVKPKTHQWSPKVSGSSHATLAAAAQNRFYEVDFYGVSYVGDTARDSFHLTASMAGDKGDLFMAAPKRLFVGAHRTNFTGAIQQRADMKIASPKVWMTYLTNEEIKAHARDTDNYGVDHPYRNAYFMEGTGSRPIPKIETLALHWDFTTLSSSDASGEFIVPDISSGSADLTSRYGPLSQIINNQHSGVGYGFEANATGSFDTEYVSSAKLQAPEVANSSEMVEIRSRDDMRFVRDQRPINYYYALEKSPYQAISDEMLNFFATIVDFNNLIGEPVNRYRDSYKQMEKIRSLFFERVRNEVDVERYVNFYRWLDSSIGEMAEQLYPASAQHSKGLRTVIESHVLERNKYRNKFPTLEDRKPFSSDTPDTGAPITQNNLPNQIQNGTTPVFNAALSQRNSSVMKAIAPQANSPLPQNKNYGFWANFKDDFYDIPSDVNEARKKIAQVVATANTQVDPTSGESPYGRAQTTLSTGPSNLQSENVRATSYSFSGQVVDSYSLGSQAAIVGVPFVGSMDVDSSNNVEDKIVLVAGSIVMRPPDHITTKRVENGSENAFDDGIRPKAKMRPETSRKSSGDLGGYTESKVWTEGMLSIYTSSLGLQFTNMHQDLGRTAYNLEAKLQSPFTKKHVGTMPHRSVEINVGNSGSLDSTYDRPEAFRISVPASNLDKDNWTAATATITFTGDPTVNQTITITSADGNSLTYTAKTSGNSAARTFDCNNGVATSAATLKTAIEDSTASTGGHAGEITVSRDGATLTLTQTTKGTAGNISITHNLSNTTVAGFTGGKGEDINIYPPEAKLDGTLDLKNKRSTFQRVEPKRLVNIRNIQNKRKVEVLDPQNREALGNFTRNYEVVQTSGRREQAQWFADNIETSGLALQNGLEIPVLRDEPTSSPSNLGLKDFQLLERETKESVFVERFSAPGGYEVMSRGYLDRRGEEVSAYNSLNYRNLFVRNSSGSMDNGPIAATATITFTGDPTANQTITITSTDGTSLTYTAKNTGNSAARTFDCNNGVVTSATTLKAAIEDSTASTGGHAGKIIVSRDGATLTLTQATKGTAGNVSITHNLSNTTVTGFIGGLALHRGVLGEFSNRTRFSGTVNIDGNDATKHDGLNALLSRRSGKFGVDSVYGNVRDIDYHTTASYHKVNRNPLRRLKFIGDKDWPEDRDTSRAELATTGTLHDNYWVSHAIPRSEFQYAWITASAATTAMPNDHFGHTSTVQGYDGFVSTSAGFVPAITFVSASDFGSYGVYGQRYFGFSQAHYEIYSIVQGHIKTDFAGINHNIYEPLSLSTNILGYPTLDVENKSGDENIVTLNYINQFTIAGGAGGDETLFKDTGGTEDSNAAGATNGVAAVFNAIMLHRNGPYQYPSWKQTRTGEHPIARHKRKKNLIDVNTIKEIKGTVDPPGERFYEQPFIDITLDREGSRDTRSIRTEKMVSYGGTVIGAGLYRGSGLFDSTVNTGISMVEYGNTARRLSVPQDRIAPSPKYRETIVPHTMSAVTNAYPPIVQSISDLAGNMVTLKHAYGNNIEYMPVDELDAKYNTKENQPKQIHDKLVEEIVDRKSMIFNNLKYSETIYPREENQHLAKVRGRLAYSEQTKAELSQFRMGQQRIFWRDNLADRQLNSDYDGGSSAAAINSMGFRQEFRSGVTGSHALSSRPARPNGDQHDQGNNAHFAFPALSIWPLDGAHASGSRQPQISRDGNVIPSASHNSGELINPVSYISMYSAINGYNHYGSTYSQVKSYFAPTTASQQYMYPHVNFRFTQNQADYYSIASWQHATEGFWRTSEFSGKKPWYDSYDEYAKDIRYMAKDHTVIPEFRISEHMDHYVSNGFKFNNRFLTLEGAGTVNLQNNGTQIHPLSASANSPGSTKYNEDFFTVYSHSDFMKHFGKVSKDYEEVASPSQLTLRCHGIKKLLPYQGFYPVLRCTQLGSLFSQSYAPYISGSSLTHTTASAKFFNYEGSDGPQHLMSLLQPFYSPGIMYNTMKSGIAVDYPVVTGAVAPFGTVRRGSAPTSDRPHLFLSGGVASSVGATISNKGNNHVFNFRMPFEAVIQPHDYIPVSSSVTDGVTNLGVNRMTWIWPFTGSQINPPHIFCDWSGQYDNRYSLAAHNFFAEIPNFFLKQGFFKSFTSEPESKFKTMASGSTYYMDVDLFKSDDFIMFQGISDVRGNDYTEYSSLVAADNLYGKKIHGYKTLVSGTLSAKGSPFGPPSQWYLTGSDNDLFKKGAQIADPSFAPFTPPYYYGHSTARLAFTPDRHFDMLEGETRTFTLDEILGACRIENTSKEAGYSDRRYTYFTSSNELLGKSYDNNMPAGLSQMRITSSVNLFGITRDKAVEYEIKNGQSNPRLAKDQASTDFDRWVIGTKFECPILNFSGNEVGNMADRFYFRNPTKDTSNRVLANQSWDTLANANFGSDDIAHWFSGSVALKGVWSGYGSVPQVASEGIFLRVKDSFPEKLQAGSVATGSLIDVCGFKAGSQRMGELAEDYEKEIFEAIVAVPFIQQDDKRKFFTIPREQVEAVVNNDASIATPGRSVFDMVTKLQKYVMPPHMDFLRNEGIDPFVVYVFEFSHKMKQKELTDIWQNVMPEIAERAEEQEVVVSHELAPGEFFNGGSPPPETRWMVFKIKQRAKTNYFEQTVDSKDDDRFKFQFKVGQAKIAPDYSYNWPYDFFSLVELAKIDAEVDFAPGANTLNKRSESAEIREVSIMSDGEPFIAQIAVPREPLVPRASAAASAVAVERNIDTLPYAIAAPVASQEATARAGISAFDLAVAMSDAQSVSTGQGSGYGSSASPASTRSGSPTGGSTRSTQTSRRSESATRYGSSANPASTRSGSPTGGSTRRASRPTTNTGGSNINRRD